MGFRGGTGADVDINADIIIKFATFALGLFGAVKVYQEISVSRRNKMREEYKFARDFLDEVKSNGNFHPFALEKGFQAIAGDSELRSEEIAYLLSLREPDRALRSYVLGRHYLQHLPHSGNLQISFRQKYLNPWSRRWRKWLYTALYGVLTFGAAAPLIFSRYISKDLTTVLTTFLVTSAILFPYGVLFLRAAVKIQRAESLVENQNLHTQAIIVDQIVHRCKIVGG